MSCLKRCVVAMLGVLATMAAQAAEDMLCASVKMEIAQELAIERQGFEATMKITNSLDQYAIEDIAVTVTFQDESGAQVIATSNTQSTTAHFFINFDGSQGVSGVAEGSNGAISQGSIAANSVGELRWLIIPAARAAVNVNGTLYFVGATLSYQYGGKQESVTVAPDSIVVKPQPSIQLDYFLTREVKGDDPATAGVFEPSEPFTLGVRVINSGKGEATNVSIDSAQPKIVDNSNKLLVDIDILESYRNNLPAEKTLLLDFGTIKPLTITTGRWVMNSTLAGTFTSIDSRFSHSDEFGGALTSLISATNSYFLSHDVRVDLPGRDAVRDYLVVNEDFMGVKTYRIFESQWTGSDLPTCKSCGEVSSATASATVMLSSVLLTVSGSASGLTLVRAEIPPETAEDKGVTQVVRSDGKTLFPENAWITVEKDLLGVKHYYINIFDSAVVATYSVTLGTLSQIPQPPVIAYITDRTVVEGGQVGFLVQASDPNGTTPLLSVLNLPTGATFKLSSNNIGSFGWFPKVGQSGNYPVVFRATDGMLSVDRTVNIQVFSEKDGDGDGMDDSWEESKFGNTNRDGTGDFDGDGISDLDEFVHGTDPIQQELAPSTPRIAAPPFNSVILQGANPASLLPAVSVYNSQHSGDMTVWYAFEFYADLAMTQLMAVVDNITEGAGAVSGQTELALAADQLAEGKVFLDNHTYVWRARAYTINGSSQRMYSDWVTGQFFINTANDAPGVPGLSAPAHHATVSTFKPWLVVDNVTDQDGDATSYDFHLYQEGESLPLASIEQLLPHASGQTSWQVPVLLQENGFYEWQVTARDDKGLSSVSARQQFLVSLLNDSPTEPMLVAPLIGDEVNALEANQSTWLTIMNATDAERDPLSYWFEVDSSSSFDSPDRLLFGPVVEGSEALSPGTTRLLLSGLVEDQRYYWRVRANDGTSDSQWRQGNFLVSTVNSAPNIPTITSPGYQSVIETLQPIFMVAPAVDPEGHAVHYRFELYDDVDMKTLLGTLTADEPIWALESALEDNRYYYWRVRSEDAHGVVSGWSVSSFFTNDNGRNDPPSISFVAPTADLSLSGGMVTVQWQDADPDSSAVISLYAVDSLHHETLLASNIAENLDGEDDSYSFDAVILPPESYRLRLKIADGTSVVTVDSSYQLHRLPEVDRISLQVTGSGLDETGSSEVWVDVTLGKELARDETVTVNFQLDDAGEARVVTAGGLSDVNYLQFSGSAAAGGFVESFEGEFSAFRNYLYYGADHQLVVNLSNDYLSRLTRDVDNDGDKELAFLTGSDIPTSQAVFTDPYRYQAGMVYRVDLKVETLEMGNDFVMQLFTANHSPDSYQAGDYFTAFFDNGTLWIYVPEVEGWEAVSAPYEAGVDYQFEVETQETSVKVYFHERGAARGEPLAVVDTTLVAFDPDIVFGIGAFTSNMQGSVVVPISLDNATLTLPASGSSTLPSPQRIVLRGVDDCDVDGDQQVHLTFPSIHSNAADYDGLSLDALSLTVADNEYLGQSLFICDYEILSQQAVPGEPSIDFSLRPRLQNSGVALTSAQATMEILGGSQPLQQQYGTELFHFGESGGGLSPLSEEILQVRASAASGLDNAKFDWQIEPGPAAETVQGGDSNNSLTGTDGNDVIYGQGGHDTIYGGDGNDRIIGGSGSDTLFGEGGNDIFEVTGSDTGVDLFNGGAGYDMIVGGNGSDVIRISNFSGENTVEEINGGAGVNGITGSSANDVLDFSATLLKNIQEIQGLAGHDTIKGSASADTIIGGAGNDTLYGNGGNDTFVITGDGDGTDIVQGDAGSDRVIGGSSNDTFSFSIFSGVSTVELIDGLSGINRITGNSANNTLDFSNTTLVNIESIDGGAGHDTLIGSSGPDVIIGGPGNDTLYGGAGNDLFQLLVGDNGVDTYDGGSGTDTIKGTAEADTIAFSAISAVSSIEVIDGDGGFNVVQGNSANNTLDFREITLISIAELQGLAGHDTIYGTELPDVIVGGSGNDTLYGNGGNDLFRISADDTGTDIYNGGEGYDTIDGSLNPGPIRLSTLMIANGIEVINGGSTSKAIEGDSANNTLDFRGVTLTNILSLGGGAGHDTIQGTEQGDLLIGGSGNDALYGNGGNDTFRISADDTGFDLYNGGEGFDTIDGSLASLIRLSGMDSTFGIELITAGTVARAIEGDSANNTLDFRGVTLTNILSIGGGDGHDTIYGTEEADLLIGGNGNDTLYGNGGNDTFRISANDTGTDIYYGGDGVDTIDGSLTTGPIRLSVLTSVSGIEMIDGGGSYKTIEGNSANNTLDFRGVTLDHISQIHGGAGHDTIQGTDLSDQLIGGSGNDVLYGNGGNDTFRISADDTGTDTYYGGEGFDTIDGSQAAGAILLSVMGSANSIEEIDAGSVARAIEGNSSNNVLDFRGITLTQISSLNGMGGHDTIRGTGLSEVIVGDAGNDQLFGYGGNDQYRMESGSGVDTVEDVEGANTLLLAGLQDRAGLWFKVSGNNILVYRLGTLDVVTLVNAVSNPSAYVVAVDAAGSANAITGQNLLAYATLLSSMATVSNGVVTLTTDQQAERDSAMAQYW